MQPDSPSERLHHLPPDFDPCAHPILALHWFGLNVLEFETNTHAVDDHDLDLDKEAA